MGDAGEPPRGRLDVSERRRLSRPQGIHQPILASLDGFSARYPGHGVDAETIAIRNLTYQTFVALGRAPRAEEVAAEAGVPSAEIESRWQDLHREHALVLAPNQKEIRMANPFSALPSPYRVRAAGRWWYGNCAWDALGICAALAVDGQIEASCPDCGEPITLNVQGRRVDDESLWFHCLVPAAHWWEDIAFA